MDLLAADLTVTLALLLMLGGALLLPLTHADTAVTNFHLTVLCADDDEVCLANQNRPGRGIITDPPVNNEFALYDYAPKTVKYSEPQIVTFYGKNFPANMQILVEGPTNSYLGDNFGTKRYTTTSQGIVETIDYLFPAKSLPLGKVKMYLRSNSANISQALDLFVEDEVAADIYIVANSYPHFLQMTENSEMKVKVEFKNQSDRDLDQYFKPLFLGTTKPYDRISKFLHPSWPYSNRAVQYTEDRIIRKGETFILEFNLKAPDVARKIEYNESFALISEGLMWIPGSDLTINITVVPVTAPPVITPPATPSTPGSGGTPGGTPGGGGTVGTITPIPTTPGTAPVSPVQDKSPYKTPRPALNTTILLATLEMLLKVAVTLLAAWYTVVRFFRFPSLKR